MLVVHGIWAYGAVYLWAEDSALPAVAPPRPGRPSRAPRQHPFAGDAAGLAIALAQLPEPAGDLTAKAVDDELTLWLPSAPDGPLASPELIRAPGEDGAAGRAARRVPLRPWRVPALAFEPPAAADLLAAVGEGGPPSGQVLAPEGGPVSGHAGAGDGGPPSGEVVPGGTLHYLAAVARLAADLAARGRILPSLRAGDDGYAAHWRPVLTGADADRARELAAGMPPLCRATESGGRPAADVLTEMLDALADAAARAWLGPVPLLPARRGRKPARIPVAERWVDALTAADPSIEIATEQDETEATDLAAQLDTWHGAAQLPAGPVRTCFRLVEPDTGADAETEVGAAADVAASDDWRVEFALQSTEDPSLVMPASDVWAGLSTAGLAAGIKHPEEELLTGLGRAARLFPELDLALHDPAPASVSLDTEGAFGFLKQAAPLLSGAGFGVLLPDWVRRARLGLKLTTRTQSSAGSGSVTDPRFGMQDLVNFRYDLAVGDQELDPA
ncbi:MAG TPA: SNF2 helicase-associated domain-containing protein, partial [Streptosporangiaceae bacterium]